MNSKGHTMTPILKFKSHLLSAIPIFILKGTGFWLLWNYALINLLEGAKQAEYWESIMIMTGASLVFGRWKLTFN